MPLIQLGKSHWQSYFDRVSRALGAKQAHLEVAGLGLGAQLQAEWVPLVGISYDPRRDELRLTLEGIEHVVRQPKEIAVEQDVETLYSVEAVDAEGERHILLLRDPLTLPPAAA